MARLDDLQLPGNLGIPPAELDALNSRFLLIAERLKSASTSTAGAVTIATHPERVAQFAAASQTAGAQFWESDRGALYVVRTVKKARVWQYEAGFYAAAFASRPADLSLYDAGFLFYATDWTVAWRWNGSAWSYLWGTYKRTQTQLAALAALLGTGDAGLLTFVTDYGHQLQWTGSAWQRGPGDLEHSDSFHFFGSAPTDAGWHACDGTASVKYLKYDGSTGTRNMPNVTGGGPCYLNLAASYSETITAAVAPTFVGSSDTTSAVSAGTPAGFFVGTPLGTHHHQTPIGVDGSHNIYALNVNGFASSATAVAVATGSANSTTQSPYLTDDVSAGTPAGTFNGSPLGTHTHTVTPTGTISLAGGDPIAHFQAIPYYRQ